MVYLAACPWAESEEDVKDKRIPAAVEDGSDLDLRRFVSQPCDCIMAAGEKGQWDELGSDLPEVAFWGRSNVGKSSLINAVMGRGALARASCTPGRTQQIVFFNLADRLMMADLPGYGHAQAPQREIAKWNALIKNYLQTRASLRCVFLLLDGRHGIKANDEEMMSFLDRLAVSYQVVLTKADQIRGEDPALRVAEVEKRLKKHPAARPTVFLTSAEGKRGLDLVRAVLRDVAGG